MIANDPYINTNTNTQKHLHPVLKYVLRMNMPQRAISAIALETLLLPTAVIVSCLIAILEQGLTFMSLLKGNKNV